MGDDAGIELRGLVELRAKVGRMAVDIAGKPITDAVRDTTTEILAGARRGAPVDTGRLRASLTASVAPLRDGVQGVVGSNVVYALPMEMGARPHWPPVNALEPWARRHGMEAFVVARAIARRGLAARRYLGKAVKTAEPNFRRRMDMALRQIVESK